MALIGGSKSSTSTSTNQVGLEGGGILASGGSTVTQEFPDTVAGFAGDALDLAGKSIDTVSGFSESALDTVANLAGRSVAASGQVSAAASQVLGTIAAREKTPLTEFLPFVAIIAVGAVIIAMEWR